MLFLGVGCCYYLCLFLGVGCSKFDGCCYCLYMYLLVGFTMLSICLPLMIASLGAFWIVAAAWNVIDLVFGVPPLEIVTAYVVDL